jgi:hypothetical protein
MISKNQIHDIELLIANGISIAAISRIMNVSRPTVRRIMCRMCNRLVGSNDILGVDLVGDELKRYKKVKIKVMKEIISGKRHPMSAIR